MTREINVKLSELEEAHNIKILFACESGSRAWGFASPDSDYDVRFIYIHEPKHYLSIDNHRDVIEMPVNEVLDISGWDIRKALRLFRTSNAPLFEWLQSPIIYRVDEDFRNSLVRLMPGYFSLRAGAHHYNSMARNTLLNDLQKDEIKLKKYFYSLRPLLAALWIIDREELPPMEFHLLRAQITDDAINGEIDNLLGKKAITDEKGLISRNEMLNNYLKRTLDYCDVKAASLNKNENETTALDQLFRKLIDVF